MDMTVVQRGHETARTHIHYDQHSNSKHKIKLHGHTENHVTCAN